MLQLILMVLGIVYAIRRPKIKSLTPERFPGVPSEVFKEWQALTIRSIDIFLWATWGVFILSLIAMAIADSIGIRGDEAFFMNVFFLALFLLFLVFSAVPGSQAKKLEKQMLQVTSREYFEISHRVLNGKSALNDIDKKGFTPLHNAAIKNQKDVVELLLANQAMVNARAKDGGTPLHYASFLGNLEIAELLLANHSDVNAKNNDGETPLHLATEEGRQEMAELLRLHGGQE